MGVAGSGKTTVGTLLATRWGATYYDADDLHPAANKAKMARGVPLNDDDRRPWLLRIAEILREAVQGGQRVVVTCSGLKRRYRDMLRDPTNKEKIAFVFLFGDKEVLRARMTLRQQQTGHFMPPTLLDSQFRDLEMPSSTEALLVDATKNDVQSIISLIFNSFQLPSSKL
uniref:Gluconokinase n=1 Tax=Arcella intermedia TaxID=1963864 RepID=A0A6B2LL14_9EUKA